MALEFLLIRPDKGSRPHRCFSQIHPDHSSHLLPPEGDHRKREHTIGHKQKCKGKLVQLDLIMLQQTSAETFLNMQHTNTQYHVIADNRTL